MMTEPLMSARAEPKFEAEPKCLVQHSANIIVVGTGSGNQLAISSGRMVKIDSSKRSVKSKPLRQDPATIGPKVSSTAIEQGVLESDILKVIVVMSSIPLLQVKPTTVGRAKRP